MIIQNSFEAHRVIAISQTAHAWISGQIARQWGNECFPSFAPVEPLCYAAEQHDRGFLDWERQPTLNPKSGLPHTFENIPLSLHGELRKRSILELTKDGLSLCGSCDVAVFCQSSGTTAPLVCETWLSSHVLIRRPPSRRVSPERDARPRWTCAATREERQPRSVALQTILSSRLINGAHQWPGCGSGRRIRAF